MSVYSVGSYSLVSHRNVTIVEVAKKAGVSNATVSAVLSGKLSNMRVSSDTRQRVVETAREMGYHPSAVARSLRRRHTNIVGLYCGYGSLDTTLPFFAEVVGGLQRGCDTYSKDLLLHGNLSARSAEAIYSELADGRIDGLIVYAPPENPLVDLLAASRLPVVAIVDPLSAIPSVSVDNAGGARMLAEHLKTRGHRNVYYWTPQRRMFASDLRCEVFCSRAAELGLNVQCMINHEDASSPSELLTFWLESPPFHRATAIACWNDSAAYGLLAQCRIRGIRVPEDLAIAGFDGMLLPFESAWRLTTVYAPWLDVAQTAIAHLVAQINGQSLPMQTILPVQFSAGDTA